MKEKCPFCEMGTGMNHAYNCTLNPKRPIRVYPVNIEQKGELTEMKEIEELINKLTARAHVIGLYPYPDTDVIVKYKAEILKLFTSLEAALKESETNCRKMKEEANNVMRIVRDWADNSAWAGREDIVNMIDRYLGRRP